MDTQLIYKSYKITFYLFVILLLVIVKISVAKGAVSQSVISPKVLASKWIKGIDTKFQNVSRDGRFIIEKEFLNLGWKNRFPNKSFIQSFYILDTLKKSRRKLFESKPNERVIFYDISVVGDEVLTLSSLNGKDLFIYSYKLKDENKKIKIIKVNSIKTIKKALFFKDSIYVVTDEGFGDKLHKYDLSGEKIRVIDIGRSTFVYDMAIIKNKLVVVSSDRDFEDPSNKITINELDFNDDSFSREKSFKVENFALQQKLLIKEGGDSNYLLFSEVFNTFSRKIITSLYRVGKAKNPVQVYKKTEKYNKESIYIGNCKDKLLIAESVKINKKRRLILSLYKPNDSEPQYKYTINQYNQSVINSLDSVVTTEGIKLFVNYSKYENVRRSDGWYPWYGFDVLDISDICK